MPEMTRFPPTRSSAPRPQVPAPRVYQLGRLISFLVYLFAAIRKIDEVARESTFIMALILLAAFLVLFLIEPFLVRRSAGIQTAFYLLQGGIVLGLGLLPPYEDTWAVLYVTLGMSVWYETPRKRAIAWSLLFAACLVAAMLFMFPWLEGLGYILTYSSAVVVFISYGHVLADAEIAQAKSQKLLAELQEAHARLEEYAAQAEELAAAEEHERLVRELHDSVSQTIFSINLTAEATRLLLEKDPGRVPEQLGKLQELTGQALGRMRALISEWRPG
jgi:signal transduction histidine kinase